MTSAKPMQNRSASEAPDLVAPVVRLAGAKQGSRCPLVLFPDGSGSPYAYIDLTSSLPGPNYVHAFESPFFHSTDGWTGGFDQLIDIYVSSFKSNFAPGTYQLAGWSIGGVIATCVTSALARSGYTIRQVTLIDPPVPDPILPMPDATVDKIVAAIRRSIGARGEKIESHFRNSLARIPHTSVGPDLFNGVKGLDKIVIANATDTEKFQNVMSDDVQRWKKILGGDAPI